MKIIIFSIKCLTLVCVFSPIARAEENNITVARLIKESIGRELSSVDDLAVFLREKGFSVNVELSSSCKGELKRENFFSKEERVADWVDSLLQNTGYGFSVDGTLINIFPSKDVMKNNPLDETISNVNLTNVTVFEALEALQKRSKASVFFPLVSKAARTKRISLHMKEATWRELLNEIVKSGKLNMWGASVEIIGTGNLVSTRASLVLR